MGQTCRIGSCKKVSRMLGIWRLCTGCSRVLVQVQVILQAHVHVQLQVHKVWIIVLQ